MTRWTGPRGREANRVLRERKRAEARTKLDEKVDAIKEKLHHS